MHMPSADMGNKAVHRLTGGSIGFAVGAFSARASQPSLQTDNAGEREDDSEEDRPIGIQWVLDGKGADDAPSDASSHNEPPVPDEELRRPASPVAHVS